MSIVEHLRRFAGSRPFLRDARGVAAVEFGLIGTLLFTMMAGAIDLGNGLLIQRDVKRAAAEIALALGSCGIDQGCMTAMMTALNNRQANLFIGFSNASLGMAAIARKDNKISVKLGPMTYLPADINAQALAILPTENDCGAVALVSYTAKPMLLEFTKTWGLDLMNFRSFNVALSGKGCSW